MLVLKEIPDDRGVAVVYIEATRIDASNAEMVSEAITLELRDEYRAVVDLSAVVIPPFSETVIRRI